jgi:Zn-dependent protease with chaperone function
MNDVPAIYFDGQSSAARPVTLRFDAAAGLLEITGEGVALRVPRAAVSVDSALGRTHRFVRLASGARCEVQAHALDALETALAPWDRGRGSWLHRLERSWPLVAASVVLMAVLGWLAIRYGVPWGARQVAFLLPANITRELGQETLEAFDDTLFKLSALPARRQAELQRKFREFIAKSGDADSYRIAFRKSEPVGANALALPSGDIVITDDLVKLANDDDELLGVLAHECGHIVHRHALRGVLQNSTVFVVIALITGDVSSATAFGGALPAFLLQTKFSREFEAEADRHAVTMMKAAGLDPVHLARMLESLSKEHGESDLSALKYLRSHPPTPERLKAIEDAR